MLVNPGFCMRGEKLGNYANITVHKIDYSKESADNQMLERTRVDIMKLK